MVECIQIGFSAALMMTPAKEANNYSILTLAHRCISHLNRFHGSTILLDLVKRNECVRIAVVALE